ncbi:MAG: RhbF-like rhizobactin siderophore biosynthesis protein [Hamadaea sp.]|uniref:IucA/IucC family protein n=1 Tax=Hamadaea sp. TaxID=2024425 RepID=UPI0017A86FBB|nr:IucA/IucC family protein [Hamadaea sp.]NUR74008.1 RhbF-like rhizobactin siderophore biosynthesis protein [Hamadaea sp.]NUT21193.1 RhbF-like rhizobactin siderophore biosynthesis protein [Hamadaea sp.]
MTDFEDRAAAAVEGKLVAALRREGLQPEQVTAPLRAELDDAVGKLALAYRRRAEADDQARASGAPDLLTLVEKQASDDQVVRLEQLATEGHNLHPCGRTRLGWTRTDAEAHDLESPGTTVRFVGVPVDAHVGDDLGERLGVAAPRGHRAQPVHEWQLGVVRERYPQLPVLDASLPASVTAAVRTLWTPVGYLKVSLDVQITSTRRTISIASTRNGPALSAVLPPLLAECDDRAVLLREPAGAASTLGSGRDLSAILREPLPPMASGEHPVPAIALAALDPITGESIAKLLLARSGLTATAFAEQYARRLLTPVLGMVTRFGVGLEAHLQNCLVTFVDGRPSRLVLRDLAGLRLHRGRLAKAGVAVELWPGSVVGTDDDTVLLAKVAYTAFQAHLSEVVHALGDPPGAWTAIRRVVDEIYDDLSSTRPDPAKADHAFLTAPTVPHKALVRMRLDPARGDIYVPMENPLHEPA